MKLLLYIPPKCGPKWDFVAQTSKLEGGGEMKFAYITLDSYWKSTLKIKNHLMTSPTQKHMEYPNFYPYK